MRSFIRPIDVVHLVLLCAMVFIGGLFGGCTAAPADIGKPMNAATIAAASASVKLDIARKAVVKAAADASDAGAARLDIALIAIDGAADDIVDIDHRLDDLQTEIVKDRAQHAQLIGTLTGLLDGQRTRAEAAESTAGYRIEHAIKAALFWINVSLAVVFAGWVASFFVTGPWGTVLGFLGTHILHWITGGISSRISGVFGPKAVPA